MSLCLRGLAVGEALMLCLALGEVILCLAAGGEITLWLAFGEEILDRGETMMLCSIAI